MDSVWGRLMCIVDFLNNGAATRRVGSRAALNRCGDDLLWWWRVRDGVSLVDLRWDLISLDWYIRVCVHRCNTWVVLLDVVGMRVRDWCPLDDGVRVLVNWLDTVIFVAS